jgi:nicastrin
VIVISARMDSASLFEGLARGADSAGTGIATLLAIVKQLSIFKDEILFHGESFGYIGSSRMVYDMKKGDFPLGINESE